MPDPDLEIRKGGRSSKPLDKGGGAGLGPPGPSPGSATE